VVCFQGHGNPQNRMAAQRETTISTEFGRFNKDPLADPYKKEREQPAEIGLQWGFLAR